MKRIALFLLVFGTSSAYAGELWEIVSTSAGPDGTPISNTQTKCLPRNSVDATHMMDELGNCKFDRKSGNDAAMTFAMTCKIQGMPAELNSMKVAGDARLNGDKFDMRYTITTGGSKSLAGGDFKMTGSMNARKVGLCTEQ